MTMMEPPQQEQQQPQPEQQQPRKRRKVERREKLRKTALCKHFDKPGGCPFPNCKFAHGREEVAEEHSGLTLAAQRRYIREQVLQRSEGRFGGENDNGSGNDNGDAPLARRGTMVERYYSQLFACDVLGRPNEDQYVHMHSNRLCVVGVARTHALMRETVASVEFTSTVLDSRVSGKKKRGGHFLLPETILCHVRCTSGAVFALRSCIRGTLLEVNDAVAADPTLLQGRPLSDGFLVIVQPKATEVIELQESFLTCAEYEQYRAACPETPAAPEATPAPVVATTESAA